MSAQAEQFDEPGENEKFPPGQAAHEEAPIVALKKPVEHNVHSGEFSAAEKEPAAQGEQPLPLLKVPKGHEHARLSPDVPFEVKPEEQVQVDGRKGPLPEVEFDELGHLRQADAEGE